MSDASKEVLAPPSGSGGPVMRDEGTCGKGKEEKENAESRETSEVKKTEEEGEEEDIDDDALEDEGSAGGDVSGGKDVEVEGEDDIDSEEKEAALRAALVVGMPEDQKARLKQVVWAKSAGFSHWPGFIYHPADVRDDLRRSCYSSAKAKEGPRTHHIIFYYNYGPNAFDAVPFKNIEPWTKESKEAFAKASKRFKDKIPEAIHLAEEDAARPMAERSPGPLDLKSVRERAREEVKQSGQGGQNALRKGTSNKQQSFLTSEKSRINETHEALKGKKKKRLHADDEGSGARPSGGAAQGVKKWKKDFERESEKDRFNRLSRNLQIMLEDENLNVPKICSTLEKLSDMTVTIEQLTESGVGQVVKGLRKHAQSEIQVQAKAAFSRWKENFKQEIKMAPEPAVPGDVNLERKRQEAHDPKEDKIESQKPDAQSYTPTASTNAETTSSGTSSGLEG